jgi:hypothetical protein
MITPEILIAKLIEVYGDNLADPEHHPIQFNHQVKVQLYYMRMSEAQNVSTDITDFTNN